MTSGKTLGSDGFTFEWYKTFIYLLVSKLWQLYDEKFDEGILLPVFHQPYFIVIPKASKDNIHSANYHLISVINVHTKIFNSSGSK